MLICFLISLVGEKKEKKQPSASDDSKPVDVSRLDLRIGCITTVKKHPDADSLYVEEVDVGEPNLRTVVSGLVKHVPLEEVQIELFSYTVWQMTFTLLYILLLGIYHSTTFAS